MALEHLIIKNKTMIEIKTPFLFFLFSYILFYLLIVIVIVVLVCAIILERIKDKIRKEKEQRKKKILFEKHKNRRPYRNDLTYEEHCQLWRHLLKKQSKARQN